LSAELGIAFVGCAHPYLPPRRDLLAAEPDVRLVGCFDPDPRLTRIVHERYGLPVFASATELLDQSGGRLAVVEGWDRDNPAYVREALKRGQAVLLEKPGARNLEDMRALVAAVRASPVPFQMAFMLAHSPAIVETQRILASGCLGAVTLARFHLPGPVGATREPALSLPDDLGGIFYADASHAVHLIVRLLGLPRRATAMLLRLPEGPLVLAQDYIRDAYTQETVERPFGGSVHEDAGAAVLDYPDKLVTLDTTGWGRGPGSKVGRSSFTAPKARCRSVSSRPGTGSICAGRKPAMPRAGTAGRELAFQAGPIRWWSTRTTGPKSRNCSLPLATGTRARSRGSTKHTRWSRSWMQSSALPRRHVGSYRLRRHCDYGFEAK
jgi:predicted dehydrogenase